jgi:hypothetical protein
MKSVKQCNKTVLAGESGCRVTYCQDCRVAEIEVGSVSLRLTEEAFRQFRMLMADAVVHLDHLQSGLSPVAPEMQHVH